VTTGASEEEIYLRSLREESIKDAIELAELDRLEIREKIKAKKAAIAVAESETALSLFKLATNEALRVEYIENSEKIFDDLRSKAEKPVSPKSARSSGKIGADRAAKSGDSVSRKAQKAGFKILILFHNLF
jgi:hypothetical protein